MDVKLLRQLDQGLLSLDRCEGHLRLESRTVFLAWYAAHCVLLILRQSCLRCAEIPLIFAVQISRAISACHRRRSSRPRKSPSITNSARDTSLTTSLCTCFKPSDHDQAGGTNRATSVGQHNPLAIKRSPLSYRLTVTSCQRPECFRIGTASRPLAGTSGM